jgi:DsbC/DsbD-like thiol-disulfide interchange protein
MNWSAILAAAALLLGTGSAWATGEEDGYARVRLVKSADDLGPNSPAYLGVHFDIEPGWHIYWRNPGGAGLATEIGWRLPDIVAADDLEWPVPVAFTQSGDIPGYGYEGSTILASRLRSDSLLQAGEMVGASISWLACRDVCVLGSAELESTWSEVPVDSTFSIWSTTLPGQLDQASPPFTWRVIGGLSEQRVQLWLQWQKAPAAIEWFPAPPEGLEVEDITIQTRGDLTRIDAVVRMLAGSAELRGPLDSLVVVTDDQQERRGWELAVDLTENDD